MRRLIHVLAVVLPLSSFAQVPYYPSQGSGGPPSGAAGGGLTGNYPAPGLNPTAVGTAIAAQSISPLNVSTRIVNGISFCVNYAGSDVSAKVNSCVGDAISLVNGNYTGIADATGLAINAVTTGEIDAGNSSGGKGLLILPCTGSWQLSDATGTLDTLKHFAGFDVITLCPVAGVTANFYLGATAGSSVHTIYEQAGAANQYIHAAGFEVLNSAGHATASHYSAIVDGGSFAFSDGSTTTNVNVNDFSNPSGGAILFRNICCGYSWNYSAFNANGGGIPITIQADSSSFVQKVNFIGDTFVDPGTGKPIISCTDTRSTKDSYADFAYDYSETNSVDTTGNLVSSSCQQLTFSHYGVYSNVANNAQQWASTSAGITLDDMHFYPGVGTWTYPVTVEPGAVTDAAGNFGTAYSDGVPSVLGRISGPSTAPSGSCPISGTWVFSKDGHATFCNAGTWSTKI